jgi:hypothetical protein
MSSETNDELIGRNPVFDGNDQADPDRPVDPVDQMLITYLDGELDEPAAAELEARLADDVNLRGRLLEFQKTWDMLDEVSRTTPQDNFVHSTIEMVVARSGRKKTRWHRWPIRVALMLVAIAVPAFAGFNVVRYLQMQPYRQFVANLEFWENVDMYDQIDNIEFLERLDAEGLFAEEIPDVDENAR